MPDVGQSPRTALPGIRIALSEGGCGWVSTMYDLMRHQIEISGHGRQERPEDVVGPHELLLRI